MIEQLTKLWIELDTKQLANTFTEYMEEVGVKKCDMRKNDNFNTYWLDGKHERWDRVMCHYYKNTKVFANDDIGIILRKKGGSYFIIQRKMKRAFEIDHTGLRNYDKNLLNEIIKDYKPLFDKLFEIIN